MNRINPTSLLCVILAWAALPAEAAPARSEVNRFKDGLAPLFTDVAGKPEIVVMDRSWLADDLPELVTVKAKAVFKGETFPRFRTFAFLDSGRREAIYDSGPYATGCAEHDIRFGERRLISNSGKRLLVLEVIDNMPGCVTANTIQDRTLHFFDAGNGFKRVLELERLHVDLGGGSAEAKEEPMRLGWLELSSGDEGDPTEWLAYSQWHFLAGKRVPEAEKSAQIVWDKDKARLELKPWK